jgi:hypothetical protein
MLISSVLAAAAAMTSYQADPTRAPRDAFTACLFAYADKALKDRTSSSEFEKSFPGQCQSEERAFLDALRRREAAMKTPANQIDEIAKLEVEDARENSKARYADAQPK